MSRSRSKTILKKLGGMPRPRPYQHLSGAELDDALERLQTGRPNPYLPFGATPEPPGPGNRFRKMSNDELDRAMQTAARRLRAEHEDSHGG